MEVYSLTANQINYWKLQEDKRHNVVSEGETQRHNVVTERETNRSNVARERETNRTNVANEQIKSNSLLETIRHNKQTEQLSRDSLNETIAHNRKTESLTGQQLSETKRHNQVSEFISQGQLSESKRHNQVAEALTTQQQQIDLYNADIRSYQAETDRWYKEQSIENQDFKYTTDALLGLGQLITGRGGVMGIFSGGVSSGLGGQLSWF